LSGIASCEFHGRLTGKGARFSPIFFGFPLLIVMPPLLHTRPNADTYVTDLRHLITASVFNFGTFISDPKLGYLHNDRL
jgi:hypothetical protein